MKHKNKKPHKLLDGKSLGTKQKYLVPLMIILILTAVIYSRSLKNGFVNWDDDKIVVGNSEIRALSPQNIGAFFSKSYLNMYEPLVMISYAVDYQINGLDPAVYHLINVLFHLSNVVLVFFLVFKLCGRRETALIVACLFGIHPMHVESVAWVTERKDVMYAFFYFISLILYLRFLETDRWKFYWLAFIAFILSLLSKSNAVTLPQILILIEIYRQRKFNKQLLLEKVPFFLLALVLGIISLYTQNPATAEPVIGHYNIIDRVFLVFYSTAFYIFHYFSPVPLSAFYPFPWKVNGWLPAVYYFSSILIILVIIFLLKKSSFRRDLSFGVLFFLAAICLNIQIIPFGMAVVSDRYAYVPYIGLSFIIGQFLCWEKDRYAKWFQSNRRLLWGGAVLIIVSLSFLSCSRISVWNNSFSLFLDMIEKSGPSVVIKNDLGLAYLERGQNKLAADDLPSAISDFDTSISWYPAFYGAYYKRAIAKKHLQMFAPALQDFNLAVKYAPGNAYIYSDRGGDKIELNDFEGAVKDFTKALDIDPSLDAVHFNLGLAYLKLNKINEACKEWNLAAKAGISIATDYLKKYCK
jgi:Tfp pilus assembly protein PilF